MRSLSLNVAINVGLNVIRSYNDATQTLSVTCLVLYVHNLRPVNGLTNQQVLLIEKL